MGAVQEDPAEPLGVRTTGLHWAGPQVLHKGETEGLGARRTSPPKSTGSSLALLLLQVSPGVPCFSVSPEDRLGHPSQVQPTASSWTCCSPAACTCGR